MNLKHVIARIVEPAFAALTLVLVPALLLQSSHQPEIVEERGKAMQQWQQETTQALSRLLASSSVSRLMQPNSAIVQIAFRIGADGRAADIRVIEGRGNWPARRAALHAVRNLDTLSRIPVADSQNVQLLANLVFYRSIEMRNRLVEELLTMERMRLASSGRNFLSISNLGRRIGQSER